MSPEPSLRDQLLADYDQHEDAIDKAATVELWALGDWLVEYVPVPPPHRPAKSDPQVPLTISDLADRRGRSRAWLNTLRKAAEATQPDRLPKITPRVYAEALRTSGWDLMAANKRLVTKGHRLRDQSGPMESTDAIKRQLDKRTPEERAQVVRDLSSDPKVGELLEGQDPSEFGAQWADTLVVRVHQNVDALRSHVAREGLVFAPSTPLDEMFEYLTEAECWIAELRAAVGERLQDERAGVSDAC